jgi:hypothetical protein
MFRRNGSRFECECGTVAKVYTQMGWDRKQQDIRERKGIRSILMLNTEGGGE